MTDNNLRFRIQMPQNLSAKRQAVLAAFIRANFAPIIPPCGVAVFGQQGETTITAAANLDTDANNVALATLAALCLSNDLVTIGDAAAVCGISIKRISAAVGVGALRGYTNPAAPNPRKGRTLVSLAECRQMWGG